MAIAPALVASETLGNAPGDLVMPDGFDIDLRCITVTLDGSGASGSFLACCSIIAASGQLIGRFFPSRTFNVGDSGEVTYAPFLGDTTATGPTVKVRRAVTDPVFNVPSGFVYATNIPWTTVEWDSDGMWNVANPTRLTATKDGIYSVAGVCNYNAGAAGSFGAAIRISNNVLFPGECQFSENGIYFVNIQAVGDCFMSAGDFVELTVEQATGGPMPLLNDGSNFSATWQRDLP